MHTPADPTTGAAEAPHVATPSKPVLGLHPVIPLVTTAHFAVDSYTNIYAPLLPVLIPHLGMTLATAGVLAMVFQLASSVAQLGFGAMADRSSPRLLVLGGPAVAAAFLSLIGLAPSVWALAAMLVLGGLGSAAFHPPAAMLAHRFGGRRRGLAMSVYITGGTLGFAGGPLVATQVVERFGLDATPWMAVPGLVLVALLVRRVPAIPPPPRGATSGWRPLRPYARPLGLLWAIVVLRTITSSAFVLFAPVLLTGRGMSVAQAGIAVACYLFASGVGGFLGGPAADLFGARRVILWSLLVSAPLLVAAPLAEGGWFLVLATAGGFCLQSTLPVNVTFGQAIAPVSAGMVSSLMMGVAWGTGSMAVPLVGAAGDAFGVAPVLSAVGLLPLVGALLARPLPTSGLADS